MNILAIDIETSPNEVYTWGLFNQNIGINQIIKTSEVLCFAAKWIGGRGVEFWSQWGDGKEAMVTRAHELLEEADVILHYNGKRFDVPHLNREFAQAGLAPPAPFHQIDLYQTAKRQFRFQSNKLEHVATQLGLPGKEATGGFELWRQVLAGNEVAQRKMRKYNRRDVTILEELYDILRPWVPGHPSVPVRDGCSGTCCPTCGSDQIQRRGFAYTAVSQFQRFQCKDCRRFFRGTKRLSAVTTTSIAG